MGNRFKGFVKQGQSIQKLKRHTLSHSATIQELRWLVDAILDEPDLRQRVYERVRAKITGDQGADTST